jgi:hypothetical protein
MNKCTIEGLRSLVYTVQEYYRTRHAIHKGELYSAKVCTVQNILFNKGEEKYLVSCLLQRHHPGILLLIIRGSGTARQQHQLYRGHSQATASVL